MSAVAGDAAPRGRLELAPAAARIPEAGRSSLAGVWARLRRDRVALGALCAVVLLLLLAALAPAAVALVGAPEPDARSPEALTAFGTPTGPSGAHLFGVDDLGRDVFSRVVHGSRVSLAVALLATGLIFAVGVPAGLLAGYYGGWLDTVISRTADALLAFPVLLLALGLAASCSFGDGCLGGAVQPGLGVVIFVIALSGWPYVARLVRGEVLSLREREFVEAARGIGASDLRIMGREILPNLAAPILVYASLIVPANVLFEAALSFLGVGVQSPTASWGAMIADAAPTFDTAWWYMLFPGLALLGTVVAFNLVGEGLRDALDPRTARRAVPR